MIHHQHEGETDVEEMTGAEAVFHEAVWCHLCDEIKKQCDD